MADQYITRFRTGTPDQRRAAIMKLGKGGNPQAITVLEQIAASEPDPALQKLTQQAIQHLQKLTDSKAGTSLPAVSTPVAARAINRSTANEPDVVDAEIIDEPATNASPVPVPAAVNEAPRRKIVTDQQRKLAKSKVDQVITHQMAGEYPQALVRLAEAAALDPDIFNTTIGANLAQTLTDLPRDQAIAAVIARSQALEVKKARGAPSIKFESGELADTLLETGLLFLLMLIFYSMLTVLKIYTDASRTGTTAILAAKDVFLGSLVTALPQYIGLQVSSIAVFVAGVLFGGTGGVLRFFRYVTRAFLFTYGLWMVGTLFTVIPVYQLYQTRATTMNSLQSGMSTVAAALFGVSGLSSLFVESYAVARAHKFGYARGCGSVIVGTILLVIFVLIVGVGALSALTNGFNSH